MRNMPLHPRCRFIWRNGLGSPKQAATFQFPGEFIAGTSDYTMTVSSFPAVRFTGSFIYSEYPHGCVEQGVAVVPDAVL